MSGEIARANNDVTKLSTHADVAIASESIGLDYPFIASARDGWAW